MPASSTQLPPAGYKLAEVGEIPDDWGSVPLAELGKMFSGGTPRLSEARFWDGEIPWVSSKDMKVARLHDAIDHVTPAAIGNGTRLVKPGTLLMVVRGMSLVHTFAVAIVETPLAFNQDLKAFLPHADGNSEFLLRWLEANQSRVLQLATESTHGTKRIPTGDLLASHVPLPPPAERRAIAEALSDVDGLLGALDALIAKKRAIKQAAMQQLLTGKTRLPSFSGSWETKRLGDVCALKSGCGITSARIDWSSTYPCFGGNGLRGFTTTFTHEGSYALIGRQGALCGNVVSATGKFFASEHALVVTARSGFDIDWLTHLLKDMRLNQYSESSAQPGLSAAKLLMLEVSSPPSRQEQSAIATVLSDIDAETAALERRRNKTRAIKQGMMQQLLTGRVRLVQPTMSTPEVATP